MTLRSSKQSNNNYKKAKYRMQLELVEAIEVVLLAILEDLKKTHKTKGKKSSLRLKPRGAAAATHH
jgi:hypothetical protein